ncbi:MAG: peptidylprolyl isomerase [Bacteroidetes bacterium]|nr:peptidylprolyl isomerase [Bacteroidota bacterium]
MKLIFSSFLFSLLLSCNIFPQYTSSDSDLVHTTFTRQFDHQIIQKYVDSDEAEKVNAALFSIAQSEDTLWVNKIINLDYQKFGSNICFALGELGPCKTSANFLEEQIANKNNSNQLIHSALEALGKTGDNNSFVFITNYYLRNHQSNLDGISPSLYNFYIRNIGNKEEIGKILADELKTYDKPSRRNFEAVFAFYRTDVPASSKNILVRELTNFIEAQSIKNKFVQTTLPYLLGCLRKLDYFPNDHKLFSKLIRSNNFGIKVEAVHSLAYYPYQSAQELDKYLALLNDSNPNVTRSIASSLKEIKLNSKLMDYLKEFLKAKLLSNKFEKNTQGELFLSYINLFKTSFNEAENKFSKVIPKEYFYQALGNLNSSDAALSFLLSKFNSENNKNKIAILESVINFQGRISNEDNLRNFIIEAINSDFPPLIAIAADGIDSISTLEERELLASIITKQVKKYSNNPDYQESIMSLALLSKKINDSTFKTILNSLAESDFYPINKFAFRLLDRSTLPLVNKGKNFDKFWGNAFKYKFAEVKTQKGNFTIKFLPQISPISVGNFCSLSKRKFFNNNSFHRVVPGFVIQGGDPEETGWGGPDYDIVSEFSPLNYDAGMVGMASAGKDTEGSQWFVTTGDFPHLNGRYTIFAKVIKGLSVVFKITQDDKIIQIKLI